MHTFGAISTSAAAIIFDRYLKPHKIDSSETKQIHRQICNPMKYRFCTFSFSVFRFDCVPWAVFLVFCRPIAYHLNDSTNSQNVISKISCELPQILQ